MIRKAVLFLRMIKFTHSVFALPFAFTAAIIGAGGIPSLKQALWIALAMVGARSGAMAMNRIIDRKMDALNPRTRGREIPSGKLRLSEAAFFAAVSFALLVYSAYRLNPLCFKLSPLAILIVIFYSYTKRFTWAAHIFLGMSIALAPLGAWIAVTGTVGLKIIPMVIAVVFWLAGFDILYALQDLDFDRAHGLFSIPARFGTGKSLLISRLCHAVSIAMLVLTGFLFGQGVFYWAGMAFVCALFAYEHSLVREDDLSRLDMAFFNMNGWISVSVLFFTALSYLA